MKELNRYQVSSYDLDQTTDHINYNSHETGKGLSVSAHSKGGTEGRGHLLETAGVPYRSSFLKHSYIITPILPEMIWCLILKKPTAPLICCFFLGPHHFYFKNMRKRLDTCLIG